VLPLRLGGLGICNLVSLTFRLYDSSVHCIEHLIRSMFRFESFELDSHFECVSGHKVNHRQQMNAIFNDEFCQLLPLFDTLQQWAILQGKESIIVILTQIIIKLQPKNTC